MVRDDVIFDIGMHRGEDTAYYLAKGFNVVGFEADPDHVSHCRTRFAEALQRERLRIVEGAIAPPTETGTIVFYKNLQNSFLGTISDDRAEHLRQHRRSTIAVEVPRIDILEQFRTFGIPHYLKIDIEGAEKLVLAPLKSFPAKPPFLSHESEKREFSRLVGELDLLRELGYRKFLPVQQKYIGRTTISTKDRLGGSIEFTFEPGASGPFGEDIAAWMTYDECRAAYGEIFKRYRWFGERSLIARVPGGRLVKSILRRTPFVDPLPGWHDTHAALA